jgi:hypothetical protein
MASYVTKEFQIRFHRPYPNSIVNKLKRRDLRILAIALGAVMGQPFVALLAVGSLTHLAVFQILGSGWLAYRSLSLARADTAHETRSIA